MTHCLTHPEPSWSCYCKCKCRCDGCRQIMRERFRVERQTPPGNYRVPADKARRYLQHARNQGYSDYQIADATGVSLREVGKVCTDQRQTVYRRTGRRIVKGVDQLTRHETPDFADGAVVRAMIVWLRDHGASDEWMSGHTGLASSRIHDLRSAGQSKWVKRSTEVAVRELRDQVVAERVIPPGRKRNAHVKPSQLSYEAQKKARYDRERKRRQRDPQR